MHQFEVSINNYNGLIQANGQFLFNGIRMPDVNLYLADGLLIDAGPAVAQAAFEDFFANHTIDKVALTHIHEDHAGLAAWLQERFGLPVYVHAGSLEKCAAPAQLSKYRRYIWGDRPAFKASAMPEKIETDNFSFRVIDSPGHHPEHCIFFEEQRGWLFTGDLYINETQDVAFKSENITDAINTIQKILDLDFEVFFCFHAGIMEAGKQLFRKKLDNFLALQTAVQDLRAQGLDSRQIDDRLFPTKHIITKVSKGEWSSLNMVDTL